MAFSEVIPLLNSRQLIPAETEAVVVVGSTARGWSNNKSDTDVYLICKKPWTSETSVPIPMALQPAHVQSESFYDGDRPWQVTYWTADQVQQMLDKVSWAEFNRELVAGDVLTPREELFLARIATGVPVAGSTWVAEFMSVLHASAYETFLISRSLNAADDAVEDTIGQWENGNFESATLSARRALGHAVDALLESCGEYGSQLLKWRPNRFRAARQELVSFDEWWAIETMRGFDPDDPRPWIDRVLALCRRISAGVEISPGPSTAG